ncbi:MAG: hypothetical protein GY822_13115 [Deltaproteobacteria bacterium]|nr:hypothetical protein [Deltaproteobacteria bacterium]
MKISISGFSLVLAMLFGVAGCPTSPPNADGGPVKDSGVVDAGRHIQDAGKLDGGAHDGGKIDAGPHAPVGGMQDGGMQDGGMQDGGMQDGGMQDGGTPDGGTQDGGTPDGGFRDGGVRDGGVRDGGVRDGGVRDGGVQISDGGLFIDGRQTPISQGWSLHFWTAVEDVGPANDEGRVPWVWGFQGGTMIRPYLLFDSESGVQAGDYVQVRLHVHRVANAPFYVDSPDFGSMSFTTPGYESGIGPIDFQLSWVELYDTELVLEVEILKEEQSIAHFWRHLRLFEADVAP